MEKFIFDPSVDIKNSFDNTTNKKDEAIIHIRIQQRNGKKSITIVENLDKYTNGELDLKKICKYFSKKYCCRSTIEKEKDQNGNLINETITLSGDNREEIRKFLNESKKCNPE